MEIIDRISHLLKEKNLTQQQLAEGIGVSFKTVSTWKTRGSNPPAKVISSIADFLGVSCRYLLTGENERAEHLNNTELSTEAIEVAKVWDKLDTAGKAITKGEIYRRAESLTKDTRKRNGEGVG